MAVAELLVVAAGVGIALAIQTLVAKRVRRAWSEAAHDLDLDPVAGDSVFKTGLSATSDGGLIVGLSSPSQRWEGYRTGLVVAAPGLLPPSLELRREKRDTAFERRVRDPDLETGDPTFDATVFVRGPATVLTALLDQATRSGVLRLIRAGGWVARGTVVLPTRRLIHSRQSFREELGPLVDLARRLCLRGDPMPLLATTARADPLPGVRLRNLEELVRRFSHRPETEAVLRAGLGDWSAKVRLLAARHLGPEGHAVLEELATASDTPEPIAAGAVRALGPALGAERAADLLERALHEDQRSLALTAVEALGRSGGDRAEARLLPLIDGEDEELAAAAVKSLVAPPSTLTALLEHPGRAVRLAAVGALGHLGTVEAVPALRATVAAHSADLDLRSAVAAAIAAIQERATGAAPGQLALAGGEAGEVALAEGEEGQVSLAGMPTEEPG